MFWLHFSSEHKYKHLLCVFQTFKLLKTVSFFPRIATFLRYRDFYFLFGGNKSGSYR